MGLLDSILGSALGGSEGQEVLAIRKWAAVDQKGW